MRKNYKITHFFYAVVLVFITLSGFAQMPIFKRYYIADIPGLGWLAKFYITHSLHYAFAVVFTGFVIYKALDYLMSVSKPETVKRGWYVSNGIIAGLIITGGLMMIKNLSGTHFPHRTIIFLDLCHLGLCMAFLLLTVQGGIRRVKKVSN